MTKAVIYVRLSKLKDDDQSTSPQRQREACEAYCKAKGWEIVDIVDVDLDVSGYTGGKRLERPGIKRVIKLLPDVDRVVFHKVDRLARSVSDFCQLVELTAAHNVGLVSVMEGFDMSTPIGRIIATILAAFAEMESASTSGRLKDMKKWLVANKRYSGHEVPYGFQIAPNPDGDGSVLIHDPVAAAAIREAAKDILAKRKSAYSVAQAWNRERTDGKAWTGTNVRRMMLGDAVCGRQAWPAVLDPVTVRRLRARYPGDPNFKVIRTGGRLLSGLLRCGTCKGIVHLGPSGNGRKPGYACRHARCDRKVGIRADSAEQLIGAWFLDRFGEDQRVERVDELLEDDTVEVTRARIAEITEAMNDGDIDVLLPELRRLRAELAAAETAPPRRRSRLVLGKPIVSLWSAADMVERRQILRQELDVVYLLPTTRGVRPSMDRFQIIERDHDAELREYGN